MIKYEINKFRPSLFKHGRFLREDWSSYADIGRKTSHSGRLNRQEYLRIEGLYVDAIGILSTAVEPELLRVHDLEFWETSSDNLAKLDLADVLDGATPPSEGEQVEGSRLDNIIRRCLREVAWLELMVAPRLLVHFGYDMRVIIASSVAITKPLDAIRNSGLFVYDSDAVLPTLDAWYRA